MYIHKECSILGQRAIYMCKRVLNNRFAFVGNQAPAYIYISTHIYLYTCVYVGIYTDKHTRIHIYIYRGRDSERELDTSAKELCISAKELCIFAKELCISAKELCISAKELCISAKYTYLYFPSVVRGEQKSCVYPQKSCVYLQHIHIYISHLLRSLATDNRWEI